jgi:hypothetical protein
MHRSNTPVTQIPEKKQQQTTNTNNNKQTGKNNESIPKRTTNTKKQETYGQKKNQFKKITFALNIDSIVFHVVGFYAFASSSFTNLIWLCFVLHV